MTLHLTPSVFAPESVRTLKTSIPIYVIEADDFPDWVKTQDKPIQNWLNGVEFSGNLSQIAIWPDKTGQPSKVFAGWGTSATRSRSRLHMAGIAKKLPKGDYHIASDHSQTDHETHTLAWGLSHYVFDRYKTKPAQTARLLPHAKVDIARMNALIAGDFIARDLINIPANDMGPADLETATRVLAKHHKADLSSITGDDLLKQNFPLIHAVGRAATQEPRLLDLRWGNPKHPKITLVGKGVCFDTGGLNIKTGNFMGLMKKDMGGAATVLGLAHMIMCQNLPVCLRVLIPAAENSISADAFRPQDVLTSRKGLRVEVNNTDAEGRLVLADALALADEESPDLIICHATLTGAARVALGGDLQPFYCDNDGLSDDIFKAGKASDDPVWRMPFWQPYETDIEPDIADLDNAPPGSMAGSITAALFLRRFVEKAADFVYLDIYSWSVKDVGAASKGGACHSARALFCLIESRYG